ncbi:MAG: type I 3-dehydroquinate dehydratase [Syntrophaceae bacterium]|nr:type I 3-dehydroquinate dehydratase [Syntrophaceae bacterium]
MICISVTATTQQKALRDIQKCLNVCDLLELRMDLIADGNLRDLLEYIENALPGRPVVITHRKTKPSSKVNAKAAWPLRQEDNNADDERWAVLQEAVRLGVAYVDVELEDEDVRVDALRTLIQKHGHYTKLICSHHDFQKTPALPALKKLYRACADKGADLIKIVPYAGKIEDNIRVLQFLIWAREQKREVVAFCMGDKGRLSRVAAPLFGAAFTFAALDEKSAAAPGQIVAKDMMKIFEILNRKEA